MNYLEIKVEDSDCLHDDVMSALKVYGCKTIGDCKRLLDMHRDYPDVFPKKFNIYPNKYFRKRLNLNRYPDIQKGEEHPKMLELFKSGKTYKHTPGASFFYETINGEIELKDYYVHDYTIIKHIEHVIEFYERLEKAINEGIVFKKYSSILQIEEHLVYNGRSMKGVDLCSFHTQIYNNDNTIVYFKIVPGTARTSRDYPYHKVTFINKSLED